MSGYFWIRIFNKIYIKSNVKNLTLRHQAQSDLILGVSLSRREKILSLRISYYERTPDPLVGGSIPPTPIWEFIFLLLIIMHLKLQ